MNNAPKSATPADAAAQSAAQKEAVMEAVAEALGEACDCTRAWSAWSCGTMGPGDFSLVAEDSDRVAEIADAAIAAMCPAPAAEDALTDAARDVLAERQRQISAEGFTPQLDDEYSDGQLARAAVCYVLPKAPPEGWPWPAAWWKPGDRRRDLVKAGALILAEIERLDRTAVAAQQGKGGAA